jgi:hypothetical protein
MIAKCRPAESRSMIMCRDYSVANGIGHYLDSFRLVGDSMFVKMADRIKSQEAPPVMNVLLGASCLVAPPFSYSAWLMLHSQDIGRLGKTRAACSNGEAMHGACDLIEDPIDVKHLDLADGEDWGGDIA